jgi:glyoxylase-like metal-dependent hydrolase (beta-lactamase superfamily II)
MRALLFLFAALALVSPPRPQAEGAELARPQADKPLDIQFIDVEGGQATLVVSPSGESLLVDTGYVGFNDRDADRIAAAVKQAGLSRIDYLVVTHYHADHVGGVPALAARVPVRTFVDHGPTVEEGERPAKLYNDYLAVRSKGRHILARPGDTLPTSSPSRSPARARRTRSAATSPPSRSTRPRTRARSEWCFPSARFACSTSAI